MSRLTDAFARAAAEDRAVLVIYLCAGDPDLPTTVRLMRAIADAGADVIEVGVPFSDPTADGPVIQRASERALAAGTTFSGVLDGVRELRAYSQVPVVLFGYYNPILARGEARAARESAEAGVDGYLVVDLPPEEGAQFLSVLREHRLALVPLIAPTTPDARAAQIRGTADAFLYYVSLTGVTGAEADLEEAARRALEVRASSGLPVAVGFGVKTPADARRLAAKVDGVVVGSAVCSAIEEAEDPDAAVRAVGALVRELRAACQR